MSTAISPFTQDSGKYRTRGWGITKPAWNCPQMREWGDIHLPPFTAVFQAEPSCNYKPKLDSIAVTEHHNWLILAVWKMLDLGLVGTPHPKPAHPQHIHTEIHTHTHPKKTLTHTTHPPHTQITYTHTHAHTPSHITHTLAWIAYLSLQLTDHLSQGNKTRWCNRDSHLRDRHQQSTELCFITLLSGSLFWIKSSRTKQLHEEQTKQCPSATHKTSQYIHCFPVKQVVDSVLLTNEWTAGSHYVIAVRRCSEMSHS